MVFTRPGRDPSRKAVAIGSHLDTQPTGGKFDGILGVLAGQQEPMGWGTLPHQIQPFLPAGGRLEVLPDQGHFVHIEQPALVAQMVIEFLEHGK
jgi:pimeloyl-ACP methyl ester carboxylesterase